MDGQPPLFKQFERAICDDRLLFVGITSDTRASFESDETAFGAGKTTLAMQLAYKLHHFDRVERRFYDTEAGYNKLEEWMPVFSDMSYYPREVQRRRYDLLMAGKRTSVHVWDDVQFAAGAKAGGSEKARNWVGEMTTSRNQFAVVIMTMDNILSIASEIRKIVKYECIVYSRGRFETQRYAKSKNFGNPTKDNMHLNYVSGEDTREVDGAPLDFAPLPQAVKDYYDKWRKEKMLLRYSRTYRDEWVDPQIAKMGEGLRQGDKEAARAAAQARWGPPKDSVKITVDVPS